MTKHGKSFEGAFVIRGVTQLRKGRPFGKDSEEKRMRWAKESLIKAASAIREHGIGALFTPLIGSGRGGMRKQEVQKAQKIQLAQVARDLKDQCRIVVFGYARG